MSDDSEDDDFADLFDDFHNDDTIDLSSISNNLLELVGMVGPSAAPKRSEEASTWAAPASFGLSNSLPVNTGGHWCETAAPSLSLIASLGLSAVKSAAAAQHRPPSAGPGAELFTSDHCGR